MRVLIIALSVSIIFAVIAFAASPSRMEPAHSRGGHAVAPLTHGIDTAVVSYRPVVTG